MHTHLAGPKEESHGKNRYLIVFVDDMTRMRAAYALKKKSDAIEALKLYEKTVAQASNLRIKRLRSDNGGEFTSAEFAEFCVLRGIQQEFTAPHSPSQNGVAERSWRTIFDMARSSMIAANLSKPFWAEAALNAVYCLNRIPTRTLEGMSPWEKWHGSRPRLHHLRVFGCTAYVYQEAQGRKKLDDKARVGIHIGYSETSPAYRVFDPRN